MSAVGNPEYEDRDVPDKKMNTFFRRWAEQQIEMAVDALNEQVRPDGTILVWREITAPPDWTPDKRGLGVYWSWDKNAADTHWGEFAPGHIHWLIGGVVKAEDVDWKQTIVANADPSLGDNEREIRVRDFADVTIVSLESEAVEKHPERFSAFIGMKYAANPGEKRR